MIGAVLLISSLIAPPAASALALVGLFVATVMAGLAIGAGLFFLALAVRL